MNLRFIDWIWHIRGSVALAPEQSTDDAFAKLDPLFKEHGTSHERTTDTLTFWKRDQAAQDRMSVFDAGVLRIEKGASGSVLRYCLSSRILLFCFLAPLLFLSFAQLTIVVGKLQPPETAAEKAEKKKTEAKMAQLQNPIDKFLGAPPPDKSHDDHKDKDGGNNNNKNKHFSPTSAYVFAGIFAFLYIFGRLLEDRLIMSLFRKRLPR